MKQVETMLVCSCNFITEQEIHETIWQMLDEDCWQLIVPGKLYNTMNKRGRCCGCFPNVVELIVETTQAFHIERHTDDPKMADLLERLNAFRLELMPKRLEIRNAV